MKISCSIMAHPKRAKEAKDMYDLLHKMPFTCITPVFDEINLEWDTGKRSLTLHDSSDWHVVLQDDAIISENLYDNLVNAIDNLPGEETIISLYTGTNRPHSHKVSRTVAMAQKAEASWIQGRSLHWGVGICIKTSEIERLVKEVDSSPLPYDNRIGKYYRSKNWPVWYTNPSLVDHRDDESILDHHNHGPRKAHNYCGDKIEFNNKYVTLTV